MNWNKIKNLGIFILTLFIVLWSARIWSINQIVDDTHVYDMNQIIECGEITVCARDSFFLSQEEFKDRFLWDEEDEDVIDWPEGDRIVGICLEVTNGSDRTIEWDELIEFIGCGFESRTWVSSINPVYGQHINCFKTNSLEPELSQEIWFITDVSESCFKEKSWQNIDDEVFYYVLSLSPYKVEIRLIT